MKLFTQLTISDKTFEPEKNKRYVAGIDHFVMIVVDSYNNQVVDVIRLPENTPRDTTLAIHAACDKWSIALIHCSLGGSSSFFVEVLQMEGLPVRGFHMTLRGKTNILNHLAMAIGAKTLSLIHDKDLIPQLHNHYVVVQDSNTGHPIFKVHSDDTFVTALALAWHGVLGTIHVDFA